MGSPQSCHFDVCQLTTAAGIPNSLAKKITNKVKLIVPQAFYLMTKQIGHSRILPLSHSASATAVENIHPGEGNHTSSHHDWLTPTQLVRAG